MQNNITTRPKPTGLNILFIHFIFFKRKLPILRPKLGDDS